MKETICVITGATSGIGLVTARTVAAMGMRIVMVGRDSVRGALAVKIVDQAAGAARTSIYYGDLSVIADMKRVAAEISAAEPRIDVLLNCAGAAFQPRAVTVDGIEKTFALNHLSYFVLSNVLLPNLRAAGQARIVCIASGAHRRATLDFDDLMFEKNYSGPVAYAKSKLANVLFVRELARRLEGTGITANAVHPGFVKTRIGDNVGGTASFVFNVMKLFWARPLERGGDTPVYVASSPKVANVSGKYFADCAIKEPAPAAQDDVAARRLWDESARLTGVGA